MALMTAAPRDESALVEAARAGDERAFGELVDPYRRALEVHCYRMLGSLHDAEDVAQEAMLKAWRSLDRFERRSSLQTWLYRIATNACLDELARRPRRAEVAIDPYPDARLADAGSPVADPEARYAQREGIELAFLTSIQRLSGRQRAVLLLRDVLGWSAAEIAELLGGERRRRQQLAAAGARDGRAAPAGALGLRDARASERAGAPLSRGLGAHRYRRPRRLDASRRDALDAAPAGGGRRRRRGRVPRARPRRRAAHGYRDVGERAARDRDPGAQRER